MQRTARLPEDEDDDDDDDIDPELVEVMELKSEPSSRSRSVDVGGGGSGCVSPAHPVTGAAVFQFDADVDHHDIVTDPYVHTDDSEHDEGDSRHDSDEHRSNQDETDEGVASRTHSDAFRSGTASTRGSSRAVLSRQTNSSIQQQQQQRRQRREQQRIASASACPILISTPDQLELLRSVFQRIDTLGTGLVMESRFLTALVNAGVEMPDAVLAAKAFSANTSAHGDEQGNAAAVGGADSGQHHHHHAHSHVPYVQWGRWLEHQQHHSQYEREQYEQLQAQRGHDYTVSQAIQALANKYRQNPVAFRRMFARVDDDRDMELTQDQAVKFVQHAIPDISHSMAQAVVDALPLTNTYPTGVASVYMHRLHLVYRRFVKFILSPPSSVVSSASSSSSQRAPTGHRHHSRSSQRAAGGRTGSRQTAQRTASHRSQHASDDHDHHQPQHLSSEHTPAVSVPSTAPPSQQGRQRSAHSGLRRTSERVPTPGTVLHHASHGAEGALSAAQRRQQASQRVLALETIPQSTSIRSLKATKPPAAPLEITKELTTLTPEAQAAFMSNKPGAGLHLATSLREPIRVRDSEKAMQRLVDKHHNRLLNACRKLDPHRTGIIASQELYRVLTHEFDMELSRMAFEHVKHVADCSADTGVPYEHFLNTFSAKPKLDVQSGAGSRGERSSVPSARERRPTHPHTGRRLSQPFHSQRFAPERGSTPAAADVHAAIAPVLKKRWKAFLDACKKKDKKRSGCIGMRTFDDMLKSFGLELSDDQFSRLARKWTKSGTRSSVMYRKFVEQVALGDPAAPPAPSTSDEQPSSKNLRALLRQLAPKVQGRFSVIRRALRAPGISHEKVPASAFFRVLDDNDIHLTTADKEMLLATYGTNGNSLVHYVPFLTDALTR
ncbi:hypothetical protein PTSG_12042 [Salpingoeca rosetta]|uniref:EF-hand domain-containing protein n=1 Tax=Salpingoeca rosetta (strain ATCC 50818 / BSB-021) TaxID=946362 RepID=F2U626_SALR5|nr:uncharacterized protein PTSG_12042 [Salpingoeca rosetta]EGD82967.1 hypothetical protein PTSG_12042 [Salpingoeca rosetta]|eukprot:XP_004995331.1 hypothetical protein PTSG_12042 [Salpingoeca rosetta]